jgi:DNA-binding NarL/FixJ family response regulator
MSHKNESELFGACGPVAGARAEAKKSSRHAGRITVLVADSDDFFRAKVESWLRADGLFQCVGAMADGRAALMEIVSKNPALAVIGLGLPGMKGGEVIWRAKQKAPSVKIAAVDGIADDSAVLEGLDAGADGLLDKPMDRAAFLDQLAEVARGGCPLSERARKLVLREYRQWRPRPAITWPLTSRQKEVAELVCLGLYDGAIARKLGISVATVRWHEKCLHEELKVQCRADLQSTLLGIKR